MKNRNAFLHGQIFYLKKKSFFLDNFTSSDENIAFYTGLDRGRFQELCGLIEAGEKGVMGSDTELMRNYTRTLA